MRTQGAIDAEFEHIIQREQVAKRPRAPGLIGRMRLPLATLTIGVGLAVMALPDVEGRANDTAAEPLFWLSLLCLFAPIAAWLIGAKRHRVQSALVWLRCWGWPSTWSKSWPIGPHCQDVRRKSR